MGFTTKRCSSVMNAGHHGALSGVPLSEMRLTVISEICEMLTGKLVKVEDFCMFGMFSLSPDQHRENANIIHDVSTFIDITAIREWTIPKNKLAVKSSFYERAFDGSSMPATSCDQPEGEVDHFDSPPVATSSAPPPLPCAPPADPDTAALLHDHRQLQDDALSPATCAVCKEPASRNHTCPGCHQPVHVICGIGEGEEGYLQEVWCGKSCQRGKKKEVVGSDIRVNVQKHLSGPPNLPIAAPKGVQGKRKEVVGPSSTRPQRRQRMGVEEPFSGPPKLPLTTLEPAQGGRIVRLGAKQYFFIVLNSEMEEHFVQGWLLRYEKRGGSFLSLDHLHDNLLLKVDKLLDISRDCIVKEVDIRKSHVDQQFVISKADKL